MSIEGTYDIRRISTKPVNIARCKTGEYIARYQDGQQQAVPACAVVDVTPDTLGQYVPRGRYEWAEFSEMMGDLLLPFMRDFIIAQAIQPGLDNGWRGPGILLDAQFSQGLIRYANKDSQGKIKWYWDLRESLQYLQEDGAIVAPPIIYDCQDSQLNLGIMTVNLAFPKKKDPPRLFKQDAGV
jgi:hypothetical protein